MRRAALTVWLSVCALLLGIVPVVTANAGVSPSSDAFTAVTPTRLLDTRTGLGAPHDRPLALGPRQVISLRVAGVAGVPVGVDAVVLNVTAVRPSQGTFLSVYPTGDEVGTQFGVPAISNVNASAGSVVPNLVTVKVGTGGDVDIYNQAGTVSVVADVTGFYAANARDTYFSVSPQRILDTRTGIGATKSPLAAGGTIDLRVGGVGGVPASADAVVLNVTAVGATGPTYVQVFPTPTTSGPPPVVSNLNPSRPVAEANLVMVGLGGNGRVRLRNAAGAVELVADVAGYFSVSAAGSRFTPIAPVRLLDTRNQLTITGLNGPGPGGQVDLAVAGQGGIPAGASAVVFNFTAASPTEATYEEAYPTPHDGTGIPTVSNVDLGPNTVRANLVSVGIGAGGLVRLRNQYGNVHMVIDAAGYFSAPQPVAHGPAPPTPDSVGVTLTTFVDNDHPALGTFVNVDSRSLPGTVVTAVAHAPSGDIRRSSTTAVNGRAFVRFPVGTTGLGVRVTVTVTAADAGLASQTTETTSYVVSAPPASATGDATNFRMDPAHSSSATAISPSAAKLWARDLGVKITYPLIVGDRAYVNVPNPDLAGNIYGSHLLALDLHTGATVWTSPEIVDGGYSTGIAYDNGRIFMAAQTYLYAFSAATGARAWSVPAPVWVFDPVTTYAGTLYVSGTSETFQNRLDCGGRMVAVNEANGATIWTAGLDVPYYCGLGSAPTLGPQGAFVYSFTQTYGFSLSGQTMWYDPGVSYGASNDLTPVLHGDTLWAYNGVAFGSYPSNVLSTADGSIVRAFSTGTAPAVAGNVSVDQVAPTLTTGYLEARDATTGALIWHLPDHGFNQPLIAGGQVYTVLASGGIDGFDLQTGRLVWTGSTPPVTDLEWHEGMAAAHGVLLVPVDNVLTAFG